MDRDEYFVVNGRACITQILKQNLLFRDLSLVHYWDLKRKLTPEVVYTILWKVTFTKNSAVILLEKPQEPHV